jgi:hypothetical protein
MYAIVDQYGNFYVTEIYPTYSQNYQLWKVEERQDITNVSMSELLGRLGDKWYVKIEKIKG